MNIYATFSGAKYDAPTARTVADAPRLGADAVWVYDDVYVARKYPAFVEKMSYFHGHHAARGWGWFTWKPLILLDALRRAAPGDVVMYVDGDTYPVAPLAPLYDLCRRDGGRVLFNALGCRNGTWTKRDVFLLMGCDSPGYWEPDQAVARFMLFEKGGAFPAERFCLDWLAYTCNPLVNTFDPSVIAPMLGLGEVDGFQENRCEQSVLGCLSIRYGVPLRREACGFGAGGAKDWDVYPVTFEQVGSHSYAPGATDADGSRFGNMK